MSHQSIEELNKTQILLLTLFVAFVTSIATAIFTVTLMEQAPPAVTQTINRIVEKTVEVTVPGKNVVERVREVPVVVTQEDLIARAVNETIPAVMLIISREEVFVDPESNLAVDAADGVIGNATTTIPKIAERIIGMGFSISGDGTIVTSNAVALQDGVEYLIKPLASESKRIWRGKLLYKDEKGFQLLKISDLKEGEVVPKLSLSSDKPELGRSAFALWAASQRASVAVGIVSAYVPASEGSSSQIATTISTGKSSLGSPIVDSSGRVIGIMGKGETALGVDGLLGYLKAKQAAKTEQKKP